ncbi:MAG: hypothetical protein IAB08_00795 [Bacteroidetes bacterium]|uniref:Phage-Barnase-EndoU-ColicinE5/D-RelE like nuclease 3 domain-containing protein n=1 Tax=Candidatus Pullibacteroides excrementavium TaxID=2840905 RepID=A0A9D9DRW0_9BACT|nr:hypothetical protein [Candidatus Pullibacteroides excrementavium]
MGFVNKKIETLVEKAVSDRNYKKQVIVGCLPDEMAKKIKRELAYNLKGYRLVVDADCIRHIRRRHPEINLMDFFLIPDIIGYADGIKKGSQPKSIVFQRSIIFDYTCVEVIVEKEKVLRLKTFWVKRKKAKAV